MAKQWNFAEAMAHNTMVIANLSAGLSMLPREGTAVMAAGALEAALSAVVYDSGRFAANFDLSFTGVPTRTRLQPREYGDGIGHKGSKGSHFLAIRMAKRRHYGYQTSKGAWMNFTEGALSHALGVSPGANRKTGVGYAKTPKVILFNPIISPIQFRADGWGRSYAENALKGGSVEGQIRGPVLAATSSYLKDRIRELALTIRGSNIQGRM